MGQGGEALAVGLDGEEELVLGAVALLPVAVGEGEYGLSSVGNDQNNPTSFTFGVIELQQRQWSYSWDTKWYLAPFPQTEINKEYGLVQNPGW